jgi:hypothetical protein
MVPVFEGKKLAGWTGWDPAVRKREVGDGERAVATPVYPALSREAPLFPGRLVLRVSPTYSHIFDFWELLLSSDSCLCRTL